MQACVYAVSVDVWHAAVLMAAIQFDMQMYISLATGMELYPRLGQSFDLKTWTNCRMGMMGWAFWILCFAVKQYQTVGHVSNAMMVSVLLMEIYIFKFFL